MKDFLQMLVIGGTIMLSMIGGAYLQDYIRRNKYR